MNEQDRFKEIAKTAADATATIVDITKKLADFNIVINELSDFNIVINELSDLAYRLGYIEGLSYVPEEEDEV